MRGLFPRFSGHALSKIWTMRTLLPATESNFGELASLYSSSIEALPRSCFPDEKERDAFLSSLPKAIDDGRVYCLKERGKALSFYVVSHSVEDYFYPQSHSYAKSSDLLESFDYQGERIVVLETLNVDYLHQGNGIGTETLKAMVGRYPKCSFLTCCKEENRPGIRLLLKVGFAALPHDYGMEIEGGKHVIFVKKYRPSGLCREAKW